MSEGRFIADTLESMLVGIAESLREAQEELNGLAPLDGFGRPMPQYRIPHLDFELGFQLTTETTSSGGLRLKFMPVTSTEASKEVTSHISGRFIAVPPGEGMPLPQLFAIVEPGDSDSKRILTLTATTSADEVLTGADIELNIDRDASVALSQSAGIAEPNLSTVTFDRAVVQTDDIGVAVAEVDLGELQAAAVVVLIAELGFESLRVVIEKESN